MKLRWIFIFLFSSLTFIAYSFTFFYEPNNIFKIFFPWLTNSPVQEKNNFFNTEQKLAQKELKNKIVKPKIKLFFNPEDPLSQQLVIMLEALLAEKERNCQVTIALYSAYSCHTNAHDNDLSRQKEEITEDFLARYQPSFMRLKKFVVKEKNKIKNSLKELPTIIFSYPEKDRLEVFEPSDNKTESRKKESRNKSHNNREKKESHSNKILSGATALLDVRQALDDFFTMYSEYSDNTDSTHKNIQAKKEYQGGQDHAFFYPTAVVALNQDNDETIIAVAQPYAHQVQLVTIKETNKKFSYKLIKSITLDLSNNKNYVNSTNETSNKKNFQYPFFPIALAYNNHEKLLYIADRGNNIVFSYDLESASLTPSVGNGEYGNSHLYSSQESPRDRSLGIPCSLAFFNNNQLLIGCAGTHQLINFQTKKKRLQLIAGNGKKIFKAGNLPYNSLIFPRTLALYNDSIIIGDCAAQKAALLEFYSLSDLRPDQEKISPVAFIIDNNCLYSLDNASHALLIYDIIKQEKSFVLREKSRIHFSELLLNNPEGMIFYDKKESKKLLIADTGNHRLILVNLKTKKACVVTQAE